MRATVRSAQTPRPRSRAAGGWLCDRTLFDPKSSVQSACRHIPPAGKCAGRSAGGERQKADRREREDKSSSEPVEKLADLRGDLMLPAAQDVQVTVTIEN